MIYTLSARFSKFQYLPLNYVCYTSINRKKEEKKEEEGEEGRKKREGKRGNKEEK